MVVTAKSIDFERHRTAPEIWLVLRVGFDPTGCFLCGDNLFRLANLTIYIIRVTLNTESDTVCLSGRHTQMAHFGVYPLVCPYSIWPGQGFYIKLFLIDAFPSQ